jgi:CheY-like chemotaxis protein
MTESEALLLAVEAAKAAQAAAEKAADKTPGVLMLLERLPGFLLLTVLLIAALVNFRRFGEVLDRVSGVKALGLEIELGAKRELAKAAASLSEEVRIRTTVSGELKKIKITADDNTRVLKRAAAVQDVLQGRRVLWLDDHPANNAHETRALEQLGLVVVQAQTNAAALEQLQSDDADFHVVISDIGRPEGVPNGLDFLKDCMESGPAVPVIFYITEVNEGSCNPAGSFGLTNRPDELVHLVIDALERIRPLA